MSKKYVYLFSEGDATMKNLLGGKGANLAEMTNIGIPIPMGFTVTTEACNKYYDDEKVITPEIIEEIHATMNKLEKLQENHLVEQLIHCLFLYVQVQELPCLV